MELYEQLPTLSLDNDQIETVLPSSLQLDQKNFESIEIKDPKLFVKLLNSGYLGEFLLKNEEAKVLSFINEANDLLSSNCEIKEAYDFAMTGDFSKIYTILGSKIRGEKTNNPIVASLAIKNAMQNDGQLFLWYLRNAIKDDDDQLNRFNNIFFHAMVYVLHKKNELLDKTLEALLDPYVDQHGRQKKFRNGKVMHNYNRFNIDSNSGLIGITPFQLALCTYNSKIINLFIKIGAVPNYVDAYSNLSLRYIAGLKYNHKSCSQFLKTINFDILKKDINGQDAIDIALRNDDVVYIKYIIYILYQTGDSRLNDVMARLKEHYGKQNKLEILSKFKEICISK